jgi:hypothetical protein
VDDGLVVLVDEGDEAEPAQVVPQVDRIIGGGKR